ncbi:MAG: serine hydrolase domain-containing protein [Candidatus Thorarchaeota archaeon]
MSELDVKKFQKMLEDYVKQDKFSGTTLVIKDDKVIFEKAYGIADKRFGIPNKIDTKFNVGSLNKIITKTAILQLVQQEKIELDDLVGKYLPDFREDIATKVKIRHLISFTSGMSDYFGKKFDQSLGGLRKVSDFVPLFIEDPLLSEPGEKWNYSNAGYVVLGLIIEAVSGIDYYDYVMENIYRPAGMKNSHHYEVDSVTENMATGYTRHMPDGTVHPSKRRNNYFVIGSRGSPAGGGYSTVHDWLLFDRAITQEKLMNSEFSKKVFMPLDADPSKQPSAIAMAGGAPGLTALYIKFFKLGYTFIVFSNYDPDDIEPLAEEIRDLVIPKSEQKKIVKMREDE